MAQGVISFEMIKDNLKIKDVDIRTYSPLLLAYVGDAVYDLAIRTYVVSSGNVSNNKLHNETIKFVSAKAQAKIIDKLMPSLSEEETAIYRRGKNAKPNSTAKNASLAEYLKATGFEALIGYLYLSDKEERMIELIKMGIGVINE